jgi:DNA-binding MurR/RpiR family transcriptional regulator
LLLEAPERLLSENVSTLAGAASVSKATAARFFVRMGYSGFREALAEMRAGQDENLDWSARFHLRHFSQAEHLTGELQNLTRSVEQIRSHELELAIRALAQGEKLWVVGFGDNYPLAHFARALLIRVKADIRMIPIGGFSVPEEFASIKTTDAVLALGVGRRTRSLRSLLRSARRAGAHVTLITDQIAPIAEGTVDVTLRCRTKGTGVFDSAVAPVSVLTYLCSSMALRIGKPALERLEYISEIHDEWEDLLREDM